MIRKYKCKNCGFVRTAEVNQYGIEIKTNYKPSGKLKGLLCKKCGKTCWLIDNEEHKRAKPCPLCKSTHTGINKLPNGNYILHCDKSCGALWDTKTKNRIELLTSIPPISKDKGILEVFL